MHVSTLLATLSALIWASPALTASLIIKNKCSFPVYKTSVGAYDRAQQLLPAGSTAVEPQFLDHRPDGAEVGSSIQFTKELDGRFTDKPILVLGYTYHKGQDIYFDLTTIRGYDFDDKVLVVYPEKEASKTIVWAGEAKPQETQRVVGVTNLEFTLCG